MVTVAILGLGARGGFTYSAFAKLRPDLMKIVALCDKIPERVNKYAKIFDIPPQMCFSRAEDMLAASKLADVMIIATQDRDHVLHAIPALNKGYHLLLEKPMAVNAVDCVAIENAAKKNNRLVVVCHVLRYTAYFRKLKELIESKIIGEVIGINHTENVAYWHYAHSFIRGNWCNSDETSPMILQKCCHDTDILYWLIGKKPISVSSEGRLNRFTPQNAPEGSTMRCVEDCKVKENCPFNAERFYVTAYKKADETERKANWIFNVLSNNSPSLEKIERAMTETNYGKCVYRSNNNVVDHQVVNINFEGGAIATLTMSAFTKDCFRKTKIYGSLGEITCDDQSNIIHVKRFLESEPPLEIDAAKLAGDLSGHGGGDNKMMEEFLTAVESGKKSDGLSGIEQSVMGHLLCFAAEDSRLNDGKKIMMREYIQNLQKETDNGMDK